MSVSKSAVSKIKMGHLLDLSEVAEFKYMQSFLKQKIATEEEIGKNLENIAEDPAEEVKQLIKDSSGENPARIENYTDLNEYICTNPGCCYLDRREELTLLHNYEIDANNIITLCNYCYDEGFRFCLFTHEIKHIRDLHPVLEDMYAQEPFNTQLKPEILSSISDLDYYLRTIGIENPCPTYSQIDLTAEIDLIE